jgi:serine-aspartate repeat-containing protein C/D/E
MLEDRQLLSVQPLSVQPIQLGVVYFEPAAGEDLAPNVFHLTFQGGAPGTRLVELIIDTDKLGDRLTIGDALFDTGPGALGAFGWSPFQIVQAHGITQIISEVEDGGTILRLRFEDFEAGDLLVFSIDVDEMGFLGPNAVVEGNEFEGSTLIARFEAPHYYPVEGTARFYDAFGELWVASGLPLPPDDYTPPSDVPLPVHTAGAFLSVQQRPLPAAVAGRVFEDVNLNFRWDPGEPGIAGVTIELWQWDGEGYRPTGLSATTDSEGNFRFEELLPGKYRLVQQQPAGFFSVAALPGEVDGRSQGWAASPNILESITLLGGQRGLGYDFAEARPALLQGKVYHDANDNGIPDANEPGIPGVTVIAEYSGLLPTDQAPTRVEVVTTDDGSFQLSHLLPGNWSLREIQPEGYLDGKDRVGTAGGILTPEGDSVERIWVSSGQEGHDYWFGELLPVSLCGIVFADRNGDWTLDSNEYPIAGVMVWLLDEEGQRIASTVTDSGGQFCFAGLQPGIYGLEEIQPAGYFDGGVALGSAGGLIRLPDRVENIVLTSGTQARGYLFREWEPASLSGFVYEDDNENGRRDRGERGIPNVRILLLGEDGQPLGIEVVTDSQGAYRFAGLTPNRMYGVQELQPAGYFDGRDSLGDAGGFLEDFRDRMTRIFLHPGQLARDYNFGELRPASLSGLVFADRDGNCLLDPGEKPIPGVTIRLLDSSGFLVATTLTDQEGRWHFEHLPPGIYTVEEVQPEGYFDGPECIGNFGGWVEENDRIVGIKLPPGAQGLDYRFIEWEPARISGFVFQDGPPLLLLPGEQVVPLPLGRSGIRGPQAVPIPGVVLRLMNERGEPILNSAGLPITAITDYRGYYEFSGIPPGIYSVYQVHPAGFADGWDTAGSKGGIAVNPGQAVDPAILAELKTDPQNDAILRIPLAPGDVAEEYNFSELKIEYLLLPLPLDPPPAWVLMNTSVNIWPAEQPLRPIAISLSLQEPLRFGPGAGLMGSGGVLEEQWSWHLSVINGGQPRQTPPVRPHFHEVVSRLDPVSWSQWQLEEGRWTVVDLATGQILLQANLGGHDGLPIVGDFNGDGKAQIGIYLEGLWFLDLNSNGRWDEGDLWIQLGQLGDLPVTGDWDGDGKTDVGIFGPAWVRDEVAVRNEPGLPDAANRREGPPKNLPPQENQQTSGSRALRLTSRGPLRADVIDHVFFFGNRGTTPVTGDWNGDGITNIGIFADGRWLLDMDGDGRLTANDLVIESFGQPGDLPIVGDWNGDGISDLGLWRQGLFILDTDGDHRISPTDRRIRLGEKGDLPIAGDFNGDGITDVGIYRQHPQATQRVAAQPEPSTGLPPGPPRG